jgi:hypothetical protein
VAAFVTLAMLGRQLVRRPWKWKVPFKSAADYTNRVAAGKVKSAAFDALLAAAAAS